MLDPDKAAAEQLARRIREYWYEQGYYGIQTTVFYSEGTWKKGRYHVASWGVRSNIGPNGFPPKQNLIHAAA